MMIDSISPTQVNKSCTNCRTTTTPLWRVGPSGPKSLCNACGIKYNKRRRSLLGSERGRTEKGKKGKKRGNCNDKVRVGLMTLEREMVLQRSEKLRDKLGEEEWAAILLMALSSGSVFA